MREEWPRNDARSSEGSRPMSAARRPGQSPTCSSTAANRHSLWRQTGLLILVLLGAIGYATPAAAHKVTVFATADGKVIQGDVYFRGGEPARDVRVTAVGPQGETLGEAKTNEEGKFRIAVRFRCDHRLIADAGEGHGAEYTVRAEELPDDLPAPGGAEGSSNERSGESEPASSDGHRKDETAQPGSTEGLRGAASREDLQGEIRALTRQIVELRRDLDEQRSQLRLQDVLGGLGYILGITGALFYFLGVRRKEKQSAKEG